MNLQNAQTKAAYKAARFADDNQGETMEFIIDGQQDLDLESHGKSAGLAVMDMDDHADDIEAKMRMEAM